LHEFIYYCRQGRINREVAEYFTLLEHNFTHYRL
jgi:hypothetical protein